MSDTRESLKAGAAAAVDEIAADLVALSHQIHTNPELGFQEVKAAGWLVQMLKEHGFEVEMGVAGMPTAFRATNRGLPGGPTIALLAEYDSLPKMGHACGHNIIGAAAVGAGIAAGKVIGGTRGTVQVIGTPAEEGGGGKVIMVREGVFAGIDAAMMVHPSNRTLVTRGSLAFSDLKLEFFGKPAHAAVAPEEGINALDACINTFVNVNALRQHVKSDVRIHGIITSGGTAVNIVPEYASATFMVRARERARVDQVMARVQTCAQAAADAAGAKMTMHVTRGYDDIRVNRTLAGAFAANLESLGEPVLEPPTDGKLGSVDMGNVSHVAPAIHPYIAIAPDGVAVHTYEFRDCAVSPAGDRGLLLAAKGMAMTAIDLLADAELLARIKDEFQNKSA